VAWAVAEGDRARRADDPEPAIDREAAARLRGVHRTCASIASAACLTKSSVPIPAANSASAYLVRVRVRFRVRVIGLGFRFGFGSGLGLARART